MVKIFYTNNKIKSNKIGLWHNQNKLYHDNLIIRKINHGNLNYAIKSIFNNTSEICIFYKIGNCGHIINRQNEITILKNRLLLKRNKINKHEIKDLIKKFNGITIYKKSNYFLIEIFY